MPLYLYLLAGSVLVPALFSFFFIDVIKKWKHFFVSTAMVAVVFLIWDAIFTHHGVWGFNEYYCLGIDVFKMPLEECAFFFVIPFCSLFIHYAIQYQYPEFGLNPYLTKAITAVLFLLVFVLAIYNFDKAYTAVNYSLLVFVLITGFFLRLDLLQKFYISFLVILIPFFIVNGVLTGMGIPEPVVWYNNAENLGVRLITIPVEDIGYAFSMLFGNLLIFEYLKAKWKSA